MFAVLQTLSTRHSREAIHLSYGVPKSEFSGRSTGVAELSNISGNYALAGSTLYRLFRNVSQSTIPAERITKSFLKSIRFGNYLVIFPKSRVILSLLIIPK